MQIASFTELFVWLLVVKGFLLPLFIIPTGSMAETLAGAYATHTCPNCAVEYPVGFHQNEMPQVVQCPNCRLQQQTVAINPRQGVALDQKIGDRVAVHGWPYAFGGDFAPARWQVVVFRNPNQPAENYIKRLIGLPNETIEIIDGDIWVTPPGEADPRVAWKPPNAQEALWFDYYRQDYRPQEPTRDVVGLQLFNRPRWPAYFPHFAPLAEDTRWTRLDTRTLRFEGRDADRDALRFANTLVETGPPPPAEILDIYAYNAYGDSPAPIVPRRVSDVRVSAEVRFEQGDGYVELMVTKYDDVFFAKLYADGRLTLEHALGTNNARTTFAETTVAVPRVGVQLALGHADYRAVIEVNGERVLTSTREQYAIDVERARARAANPVRPSIEIAAAGVVADLAHVRVARDVHYRAVETGGNERRFATGGLNNPIEIGPDAYFVLGDNSPASLDSRWWTPDLIGPHLQDAYHAGEYRLGTVPADQMIGQAFLVYWPGFLPILPNLPNILPDLGRVRWIH